MRLKNLITVLSFVLLLEGALTIAATWTHRYWLALGGGLIYLILLMILWILEWMDHQQTKRKYENLYQSTER